MNDYELLLEQISKEVPVIEMDLRMETGLDATYEDNVIYLDKNFSWVEKKIHLSEEFSHHKTSVGNILDYNDPESRKQEWKARRDSIERLVSLDSLIDCAYANCKSKYECAEYLNVTEPFLDEVMEYYHAKYGNEYLYRGCIFNFTDESIFIINTNLN
ncbi:toxin [Enterococcus thailandicus]|uniref:hypothetical protein n=1 Tax=Enterococcus TaxID=1350 RepID=UPI000A344FEA|nr:MULTISPECIES: hypothetical protein [Enterococcus]MDK4353321.1 toxin [Enterococcus thailandicus]MDT2752910.1 toxin [Enterococcus thailandicus]MDT2774937.1 toxin [Enterococcus thailandicus]OTP23821.1 hypothetical protein A5800_001678 [Enterococcus sp. 5B7_DIV0075]